MLDGSHREDCYNGGSGLPDFKIQVLMNILRVQLLQKKKTNFQNEHISTILEEFE